MPNLIHERELRALLTESKGFVALADKPGSDDYAFLEETVLPTLLPALADLLEKVQQKEQDAAAANAPEGSHSFNSIRWLAEQLMRSHPNGGVFKPTHAYAAALTNIGERQRGARVERERIAAEEKDREEKERATAERARVEEVERVQREKEEARNKAKEAKEAEKNRVGEEAAAKAMGDDRTPKILAFRAELIALIKGYDFRKEDDTAGVNSKLFKMAARMVVTNTAASFAGCADLHGDGDDQLLHLHSAADKKEAVIEEDEGGEDDEIDAAPKILPPPEISDRELPPRESDDAYILRRGTGISWPAIDENKQVLITDTKYTEGTVFFDGEKRQGTYACVGVSREGRIAGMLTADTLDSMSGKELIMSDVHFMGAIAVVLGEALDLTTSALVASRRAIYTQKIRTLSSDPATVPSVMAEAVVAGISSIVHDREIAVGVVDTVDKLRLLVCQDGAGNLQRDIVLNKKTDPSERAALIFQAASSGEVASTNNDLSQPLAIALPVVDDKHTFSSAIYIAASPTGKALSEDAIDFLHTVAPLTATVLLPPRQNAQRLLGILASSGIGDGAALYDAAAQLCERHSGSNGSVAILIGLKHGADEVRVVKTAGGGGFRGTTGTRAELPLLFSSISKAMYVYDSGQTCVPLLNNSGGGAFGGISLNAELDADARAAVEGIAAALSSALTECDFRRKMAVCGSKALESLRQQAPAIRGAFFAFYDVGGRYICAESIGEGSQGWGKGVMIEASNVLRVANIPYSASGGEEGLGCGVVGTTEDLMEGVSVGMFEDMPEETMANVASTLSRVARKLAGEGPLLDHKSEVYGTSMEELETNFNASRFDRVMAEVQEVVDLRYINAVKHDNVPLPAIKSIIQAIMFILGHQELDVSEWTKCRKLITHHIFKEMKMIDVRGKLKTHKLSLAKKCIEGLQAADIAMECGPKVLMLWKWVNMMLAVQGLA